ncbi:MAG: hypothetical protein U0235_34455 [Polyangiaceae bacterium]
MPSGEHGTLIGAMLDLGEKRRSGVLTVSAEEVTTHVTFDGGAPIDAVEEGTPGEPLGRLLVRTRVLSPEQHAKVIDAMASSLGTNKEQKFGEVAVALGFLTKEKLGEALREQVRWRIVRALQRENAEYRFEEGAQRPGAGRHDLSLDAIIFDAVRWFEGERRRAAVEGRGPFYVALRGQPNAVARRFGMTPEEQSALETIDGTETVADRPRSILRDGRRSRFDRGRLDAGRSRRSLRCAARASDGAPRAPSRPPPPTRASGAAARQRSHRAPSLGSRRRRRACRRWRPKSASRRMSARRASWRSSASSTG